MSDSSNQTQEVDRFLGQVIEGIREAEEIAKPAREHFVLRSGGPRWAVSAITTDARRRAERVEAALDDELHSFEDAVRRLRQEQADLRSDLRRRLQTPSFFGVKRDVVEAYLERSAAIDVEIQHLEGRLVRGIRGLVKGDLVESLVEVVEEVGRVAQREDESAVYSIVDSYRRLEERRSEHAQAQASAADALAKGVTKRRVCAALHRATDDPFETAKVLTPVLFPLAAVGVIPMDTLVFSYLAMMVARIGVAALCADVDPAVPK